MAGPGAGAPEHRTMRGSPDEAVGGRDPGQGGQSISGTGRTGCTGLPGRTWCCWKFQWEVGMAVFVFETPCDEVRSSS